MEEKTNTPSEIEQLTNQIRSLIRSQSYFQSFMRGVASGFGSVVGATIVVAVLLWMVSQIQIIPIIGAWMADIVTVAEQNLRSR